MFICYVWSGFVGLAISLVMYWFGFDYWSQTLKVLQLLLGFSFISGLIADIDIESEKYRWMGSARLDFYVCPFMLSGFLFCAYIIAVSPHLGHSLYGALIWLGFRNWNSLCFLCRLFNEYFIWGTTMDVFVLCRPLASKIMGSQWVIIVNLLMKKAQSKRSLWKLNSMDTLGLMLSWRTCIGGLLVDHLFQYGSIMYHGEAKMSWLHRMQRFILQSPLNIVIYYINCRKLS